MNLQRRFRGACGALLVGLVIAISTNGSAQQTTAPEGDYGYEGPYSPPKNPEGATRGHFWTGGNQKFWARCPDHRRQRDLLNYVDSRRHGRGSAARRDHAAGMPAATAPDKYGLWMDRCDGRRSPGPRRSHRHRRPPAIRQPGVRAARWSRRRTCRPGAISRRISSACRAGSATSASTR